MTSEPTAAFKLTAHEVLRGVAVRNGELVLRPAGWVQAACLAEGALMLAAAVGFTRRGGGWWLLVLPVLGLAAHVVRGAMVSVRASDRCIVVRNRWSTHRVDLGDVAQVLVDEPIGERHRPELLVSAFNLGRDWEVGVIRSVSGPAVWCDALVSMEATAPGDASTHADTKIGALRRWIAAYRAPG